VRMTTKMSTGKRTSSSPWRDDVGLGFPDGIDLARNRR
jgi:hypothetical protein